jgi:hypothetical protein
MKLEHSPTHKAWKPFCPLAYIVWKFLTFPSASLEHNASSAERVLLRQAKRPLGTITHSGCKDSKSFGKFQEKGENN